MRAARTKGWWPRGRPRPAAASRMRSRRAARSATRSAAARAAAPLAAARSQAGTGHTAGGASSRWARAQRAAYGGSTVGGSTRAVVARRSRRSRRVAVLLLTRGLGGGSRLCPREGGHKEAQRLAWARKWRRGTRRRTRLSQRRVQLRGRLCAREGGHKGDSVLPVPVGDSNAPTPPLASVACTPRMRRSCRPYAWYGKAENERAAATSSSVSIASADIGRSVGRLMTYTRRRNAAAQHNKHEWSTVLGQKGKGWKKG